MNIVTRCIFFYLLKQFIQPAISSIKLSVIVDQNHLSGHRAPWAILYFTDHTLTPYTTERRWTGLIGEEAFSSLSFSFRRGEARSSFFF
ncbi:hypothetical protein VNO77_18330 [Canavalia gladiata]|uniref:Uncharacterized protein n=1 Tax=Canavalia gladiata TaxID=3824 RepID=A0AAN9QNK9_CANGL